MPTNQRPSFESQAQLLRSFAFHTLLIFITYLLLDCETNENKQKEAFRMSHLNSFRTFLLQWLELSPRYYLRLYDKFVKVGTNKQKTFYSSWQLVEPKSFDALVPNVIRARRVLTNAVSQIVVVVVSHVVVSCSCHSPDD